MLSGLPPTPTWGDVPNPFFIMGFGADGPKKRAGCGVQPRSAKPRACLNRIGTLAITSCLLRSGFKGTVGQAYLRRPGSAPDDQASELQDYQFVADVECRLAGCETASLESVKDSVLGTKVNFPHPVGHPFQDFGKFPP